MTNHHIHSFHNRFLGEVTAILEFFLNFNQNGAGADVVMHAKGHTGIPRLWTQVLDSGAGLLTLDSGCWTLDAGRYALDTGHCRLTGSDQNQNPVSDSA